MRLAHHRALLEGLRRPTPQEPWRVLFSGCLAGLRCGVDGSTNGEHPRAAHLMALPTIRALPFCPEAHSLGVPRGTPDLHGGDGFDVLDGRARALDERGADLTEAMIAGGQAMLAEARAQDVDWALLMDMSGACGTQVVSLGCRFDAERRYQRGVGVAAALLLRAGVLCVSQRDFRTLGALQAMAEPGFAPETGALDHHEHPWVLANLPV
ncbi:MAG: DUF523 domain-containing protein [Alphaproteobacteria bacterium]|nr:DUF523 domain-containing protein [Alphaproteobacteria bacterium]MCB9794502.1 DUF523 domain-containing protein [Alphaproteobacteria bacterium]